ncbi:hypothetical protein AB4571_01835 [Vibrio breoganii]|uniref:hypothetical protein n=1 Tax=Vibrio breoganii TaxID=553239 RepID=UPI000C84A256|nr:hypothetical protein [Vibrio breoganii]PML12654.1 hypothetical protein BCT84_01885 [Vibrio breoganii]
MRRCVSGLILFDPESFVVAYQELPEELLPLSPIIQFQYVHAEVLIDGLKMVLPGSVLGYSGGQFYCKYLDYYFYQDGVHQQAKAEHLPIALYGNDPREAEFLLRVATVYDEIESATLAFDITADPDDYLEHYQAYARYLARQYLRSVGLMELVWD